MRSSVGESYPNLPSANAQAPASIGKEEYHSVGDQQPDADASHYVCRIAPPPGLKIAKKKTNDAD